jgi:hypothetical protein
LHHYGFGPARERTAIGNPTTQALVVVLLDWAENGPPGPFKDSLRRAIGGLETDREVRSPAIVEKIKPWVSDRIQQNPAAHAAGHNGTVAQ